MCCPAGNHTAPSSASTFLSPSPALRGRVGVGARAHGIPVEGRLVRTFVGRAFLGAVVVERRPRILAPLAMTYFPVLKCRCLATHNPAGRGWPSRPPGGQDARPPDHRVSTRAGPP